jgi:hypothetical protein
MRCLLSFLFCMTVFATLVDRLAVTVGSTVITELQIDEELRVVALLNDQPVVRDQEARRAAADRLVEQILIQHEIELSRYPAPSDEELDTRYAGVEEALGGAARLRQMLASYHVTQQTLRAHLAAQLTTLSFIEFRFRPDVNISETEIQSAYRRQVAALQAADPNTKPPNLDADRKAKLSDALLEERTDAALNSWLAESRKQISIVYVDASLQ